MKSIETKKFVEESNRIEGITRPPTKEEIEEHDRFISLPVVTVEELEKFVSVYQPNAVLRDRKGLDVYVGNHAPSKGGPYIRNELEYFLKVIKEKTPYEAHCYYETLHPFTDCNGRSGRALWAWHTLNYYGFPHGYPLGFLHHFYYQSLSHYRG